MEVWHKKLIKHLINVCLQVAKPKQLLAKTCTMLSFDSSIYYQLREEPAKKLEKAGEKKEMKDQVKIQFSLPKS